MEAKGKEALRVLIAGGGVAALEALLTLHELAGDRVATTLMAPDDAFRYRQLSVAMPFGLADPTSFPLDEIARENGGLHRRAALAEVDADRRVAITSAGTEVPYDALLVATGVRATDAVPGALTFAGFEQVDELRKQLAEAEGDPPRRVVFAVPDGALWSLALYELAMLLATDAERLGLPEVGVTLVTPEPRPLALFGKRASDAVGELLDGAGVDFVANRAPVSFADGTLELSAGPGIFCDLVVSLPTPVVPEIPGLPQRPPQRFIPVDRYMGVDGLERVWAAGDATWFPVKQGGIAAQQADVAATAIAELAGAPVRPDEFHPVLRGAILTGQGPRYLRAEERVGSSAAARSVLWWPPSKVAGLRLAPYLARKAGGHTGIPDHLTDLEAPPTDDVAADSGHDDVVAMALDSADIHAAERDFDRALDWLKVAEDLELYLPPGYELKRTSWTELARQGATN